MRKRWPGDVSYMLGTMARRRISWCNSSAKLIRDQYMRPKRARPTDLSGTGRPAREPRARMRVSCSAAARLPSRGHPAIARIDLDFFQPAAPQPVFDVTAGVA